MVWPKEGYFWSKSSLRAEEATVPTGLERTRAQCPGQARPGGLRVTWRGRRSRAPRRPQPGCELGLRRTLLAARGRYSLSLSARAAAARATWALWVPPARKYFVPGSSSLPRKGCIPLSLGALESRKTERKGAS